MSCETIKMTKPEINKHYKANNLVSTQNQLQQEDQIKLNNTPHRDERIEIRNQNKKSYINTNQQTLIRNIELSINEKHVGQINKYINVVLSCQSIIKQQQDYIGKLQKDNSRKDTIIANLLSKKQPQTRAIYDKNLKYGNSQQIQQMVDKINQLHDRLQSASQQNSIMRLQIEQKNRTIRELSDNVSSCKREQEEIEAYVKQLKQSTCRLKEVYEAKIGKLLAQLKRKIEDDVRKAKQRQMNIYIQSNNQYMAKNNKKNDGQDYMIHEQDINQRVPTKQSRANTPNKRYRLQNNDQYQYVKTAEKENIYNQRNKQGNSFGTIAKNIHIKPNHEQINSSQFSQQSTLKKKQNEVRRNNFHMDNNTDKQQQDNGIFYSELTKKLKKSNQQNRYDHYNENSRREISGIHQKAQKQKQIVFSNKLLKNYEFATDNQNTSVFSQNTSSLVQGIQNNRQPSKYANQKLRGRGNKDKAHPSQENIGEKISIQQIVKNFNQYITKQKNQTKTRHQGKIELKKIQNQHGLNENQNKYGVSQKKETKKESIKNFLLQLKNQIRKFQQPDIEFDQSLQIPRFNPT